jgi:hypothetical protein
MNARIRTWSSVRGIFALLILCALAIRVAIPVGYMPTQSIHGIVISLCTGEGAVKAVLPIEKKGDPQHHQGKSDGPCAFAAGLGGPLLDHPLIDLIAPVRRDFGFPVMRAIADLTVHRLAAPPPPSQAPPARA